MKITKKLEILFIIVIFLVLLLFIVNTPILNRFSNQEKLIINEILASNKDTITAISGKSYDYIEIYNGNDYEINLDGYYLSDDNFNLRKWKFPEVIIEPYSYLIVYASGLDKYEDDEIHTNFKLSKSGEVITLSNPKAKAISRVYYLETADDTSYGYNGKNYVYFYTPTPKEKNSSDYSKEPISKNNSKVSTTKDKNNKNSLNNVSKDVQINEVSSIGIEAIELKNLTDDSINLSNYSIEDNSGKLVNLPSITISSKSYIVLYGSDNYSYSNGKVYLGFHINNGTEIIKLYKDNELIDTFEVGRQVSGVSSGLNDEGKRVFYKASTLGSVNSSNYYLGYCLEPIFSKDGGYVEKGTEIKLKSSDGSTIYYTLDGSFPTKNSNTYSKPITINKTTVIKAIAYKDNYLESDVISRTYFVGRKHENAIISISTDSYNLFGSSGIITNYHQNVNKIINFEFYESDGNLGISFKGDTKLSGADSREFAQKSMSIFLRKQYGLKEVTYPFFKDSNTVTYSSFLLRNAGEDPKGIRIMDAVLTQTLKGQMDIDMQDYRPVVVYINGEYYGLYNLRQKLNGDYIESVYGIDKSDIDLIKYTTAKKGNLDDYNALIKYINTHDTRDSEVYEYIKTQIDIEEMINYLIAESYYGNTDLGNIEYWKSDDGKWRWMIYDLDWSMWNSSLDMGYTVINKKIPAVTYLYSLIEISRKLYLNSEYKNLYLKSLSYHLKNTFLPSRMNKIVDELSKEIEYEIPYHIERWGSEYNNLNSVSKWNNNLSKFKNMISDRYNFVIKNIKSDFNLTNEEYENYFKGL